MKKTTNKIWVTFQKEGVHCYPAAATDPSLSTGKWDDVSFLGAPHRHIFHFKVSIDVFTDDRDIEFIQFKRWIERLYSQDTLVLDHKSCEMISDELYLEITKKYPGRKISIEISEDNENGSYAEYDVDESDSKVSDVEMTTVTDSEGNEKNIYSIDVGDIDRKVLEDFIERTKKGVPLELPSKDPHLDLTFDQTLRKIDAVTPNMSLSEPVKEVSMFSSLKSTIKGAWKFMSPSE